MRTQATLAAIGLSALLMSACNRGPAVPPVEPVKAATGTSPAPTANTSVPSADAVLAPANGAPKADATAGRSTARMSEAQESSAMPMPGQANDHSAPVVAAKRASAPQ